MHYVVGVILPKGPKPSPSGQELTGIVYRLLDPYATDFLVEPYVTEMDPDAAHGDPATLTPEELAEAAASWYGKGTGVPYWEDGKLLVEVRHNPRGYLDYWTLGGRWAGYAGNLVLEAEGAEMPLGEKLKNANAGLPWNVAWLGKADAELLRRRFNHVVTPDGVWHTVVDPTDYNTSEEDKALLASPEWLAELEGVLAEFGGEDAYLAVVDCHW